MVNLRNRAILITSDTSHIEMEKAQWFRHQEHVQMCLVRM